MMRNRGNAQRYTLYDCVDVRILCLSLSVAETPAMAVDSTLQHAATQFFVALRNDEHDLAYDLLQTHPALASFSVHTAAAVGDEQTLRRFLADSAANATAPSTPDGIEPIIFAAAGDIKTRLHVSDTARAAVVSALLDAGASPNAFVQLPHSSNARISALYFACVSNNVPAARVLLERGANPNDGESVFHAAEHDHRECLELLHSYHVELSGVHANVGNTPLYFLSAYPERHERIESVTNGMRWLLDHGADPNVPSQPSGERPLHRLVLTRSLAAIQLFVDRGAQVNVARADGTTPYALAVRAGKTDVADYLVTVGADTTVLRDTDRFIGACARGDEHAARELLVQRPDIVSTLTLDERRALHSAVFDNRTDSVRLMLALGWPLDDESEWHGTALHWAAWNGLPTLVRMLLERGAPVNVRDGEYGSSPIAWASHGSRHSQRGTEQDYLEIVELLLKAGSTREASFNRWGEAPESMAAPAIAALLRQRGFGYQSVGA